MAVSAVLSAGLVAGHAAADSITAAPTATATWSDPPARIAPKPVVVAPAVKVEAAAGPACTANAFSLASACTAQGRAVRVIALTQR
ncbi:hypothetical protein [Methylobacterium sp. Leaf456]|uniref:hypothetical protein n=1 Tax=Methylobacterium sp. Leaf456 TaxID=1736382 RepID=UPI0012E3F2CE|nr:hypothetical protein [Methylobacterium sp. Leaf456]